MATTAMAQDWVNSKYGLEDEIGAANLITPESVLKASELVKTGETYNLGLAVLSKTPTVS